MVRRALLLTVHVLLTVAALSWALALRQDAGWDAGFVLQAASENVATGQISESSEGYLQWFPNNIGTVAALSALGRITGPGEPLRATAIGIGIALMSISVLLVYSSARRIGGTAAAIPAAGLTWLLVGFSPWMAVPYTDSLGLIFPIAVVYCVIRAWESPGPFSRRVAWTIAAGLLTGAGYQVKPTIAIVAISACLLLGLRIVLVRSERGAASAMLAALVLFSVISALSFDRLGGGVMPDPPNKTNEAMPVEYWMLMGLSENGVGTERPQFGGWDGDTWALLRDLPRTEERSRVARRAIVERLRDRGPLGYLRFITDKATWVFSDGTFYVYGEGDGMPAPFVGSGRIARWVQSVAHPLAPHGATWATALQTLWLLVLGSVVVRLARDVTTGVTFSEALLLVATTGFVVYLLLFEARSRYLFISLPIIILLMVRESRSPSSAA